jgi:hypothetical protein
MASNAGSSEDEQLLALAVEIGVWRDELATRIYLDLGLDD